MFGFWYRLALDARFRSYRAKGIDEMLNDDIQNGHIRHAALAQLHRWYQFYESPNATLENQLDILSDTISLKSGLGEAVGHAAYCERLKDLPDTWLNAHFVNNSVFRISPDGMIHMDVDLHYLNQGMLPDQAVRAAELSYKTVLSPSDTVLPKFTSIEISEKKDGIFDSFVPAYPENRLASLAHYWLALLENPEHDSEPFREILADGFSLNFASGALTDFEEFKEWLAGPVSQIPESTYDLSDLAHEQLDDNIYRFTASLDWRAVLADGRDVTSKTKHVWLIEDNPAERFARIKTMDASAIRKRREPEE